MLENQLALDAVQPKTEKNPNMMMKELLKGVLWLLFIFGVLGSTFWVARWLRANGYPETVGTVLEYAGVVVVLYFTRWKRSWPWTHAMIKNRQRESQLEIGHPLTLDQVRKIEKNRNLTMKGLWKTVLNFSLALGPFVISVWITRSYGLRPRAGGLVYLALVCVVVALVLLWSSGMHGDNDPFRKRKKRG